MIMRFIRWIINFFTKYKRGVIAGAAGIGATGVGVGAVNAHQAKRINKQALEIQQAALNKHDQTYNATQQVLAELGEVENAAIDSFPHFADTMEQIQGRPKMKTGIFVGVKLPDYEPEEIKILSTEVRMAIAGAGGVGAGILVGLAAFGAGALVAAPAMVGAGLVLCVKGFGLKKKVIENKRQAQKMAKSVDEIVDFYTDLGKAASQFKVSVAAVYHRYTEYIRRVESTLQTKSAWKQFSHEEKETVKNTILLARLLYSMVQTPIVLKKENEGKLETVNSADLVKLQKQATRLLGEPT